MILSTNEKHAVFKAMYNSTCDLTSAEILKRSNLDGIYTEDAMCKYLKDSLATESWESGGTFHFYLHEKVMSSFALDVDKPEFEDVTHV